MALMLALPPSGVAAWPTVVKTIGIRLRNSAVGVVDS